MYLPVTLLYSKDTLPFCPHSALRLTKELWHVPGGIENN
jgi:hypothetical protein